jgi:hypothetical protein
MISEKYWQDFYFRYLCGYMMIAKIKPLQSTKTFTDVTIFNEVLKGFFFCEV